MLCAIRFAHRVFTNPVCHLTQDGCSFLPNYILKIQETLIEAINVNNDLRQKSLPDMFH
jgi:hypothetical protein